uniref:Uncharacterized protein n=1 Tax=Magnetococcus massalia (strain MO-1) TaxID=451514 RepID=A0A1S7LIA5_MAGMO|nr:conserved protein of unknown function [Candidatus Magnetococcus massalia]
MMSSLGWGHGLFSGLGMVLVWLIPIVLIIWVLQGLFSSEKPEEDAKAILKKRFARGELNREEYLNMLRDLDQRPA